MYGILADLQKQITLCKVPALIGVGEYEEADKLAKHNYKDGY